MENLSAAPFVIERTYNAPVSRVWDALTNPEKMKQWYFKIPDFKPEVGFEFSFTGGSPERSYLHKCRIIEVVEGEKLVHTWTYDGYEGYSEVTFELFDEGENITRVKLTHTGLESFPQATPDFAPESFAKGWTYIVGTGLKNFVEAA